MSQVRRYPSDRRDDTAREGVPFQLKRVISGVVWTVSLSILALWVVLKFSGLEGFFGQVRQVRPAALVGCVAAIALTWWLDTIRLIVLARSLGRRVGLLGAFKMTLMSAFMAGVTPFDTGGEPLKVYLLHKEGVPVGEGAAVVALAALLHATSRLFLFLAIPVIALVTGVAWVTTPGLRVALAVGFFVYVVLLALLVLSLVKPEIATTIVTYVCNLAPVRHVLPERIRREAVRRVAQYVEEFRQGVLSFSRMRRSALAAGVLSVGYWLPLTLIPYFVLRGMGVPCSYWAAFVASISVYFVMAYVPTPGSSGGAEVSSAALFARMIPGKLLGVFVLVWRAVTFYLTMLVGGLFLCQEVLLASCARGSVRG